MAYRFLHIHSQADRNNFMKDWLCVCSHFFFFYYREHKEFYLMSNPTLLCVPIGLRNNSWCFTCRLMENYRGVNNDNKEYVCFSKLK